MFLLFLSALVFGGVLFKLGVYSTIITIFNAAFKILMIGAGLALVIFLYRKFKGGSNALKLPKGTI